MQSVKMTYLVLVVTLFCFAGQAQAQDGPGPTDSSEATQTTQTTAPERFLELLGELAKPLVPTQGGVRNCDAVAKSVASWCDQHGEEMKVVSTEMAEHFASFEGAEGAQSEQLFTDRFSPMAEVLMGAALDCAQHPGTQEALKKMDHVLGVTQ